MSEFAAGIDKLIITAFFYDAPVFQYKNAVNIAYGRQTVRNDKSGTPFDQRIDCILYQLFGNNVERACRFIKNKNVRVPDKGARNSDTLALPS